MKSLKTRFLEFLKSPRIWLSGSRDGLDGRNYPDGGSEAHTRRCRAFAKVLAEWARGGLVELGNEFRGTGEEGAHDVICYELANEALRAEMLEKGEGWVQIAPYGRSHHVTQDGNKVVRRIQMFERQDAVEMVNEFNSLLWLPLRVLGLPWYIGHPDNKAFQHIHKDWRAKGRIKELEAREDGLYGRVKFNKHGLDLIANEEFHGHSPNWLCAQAGQFFRPRFLKSVGFTNSPNLEVMPVLQAALANEQMDEGASPSLTPQQTTMNTKLRDLLLQLGFLKPGAGEAQVDPALDELANSYSGLKDAATECDRLRIELANEKKRADDAEAAQTAATTELANERAAVAGLVLDRAVSEGRVLPADRESTLTELANESGAAFVTRATGILSAEPVIKTRSGLPVLKKTGLGDKPNLVALANEMVNKGEATNFNDAWAQLKEKRKELFDSAA